MRLLPFIALCIILPACAAPPAAQQTIRICDTNGCVDRPRNYSSGDLAAESADDPDEERIAALQRLAEKDARAAYDLGLRFFRGDGIRQDSYQALVWMRKAAEMGDLQAQKALGRFYLTGLEEMGSDPAEAEKWLSIAASRGDKESRQLLAEASAAKKSEAARVEWANRWRPVFYGYWHSQYPYRSYWRRGVWGFY